MPYTLQIHVKFIEGISPIEIESYGEIIKDRLYDDDEPNLVDVTYEVIETKED